MRAMVVLVVSVLLGCGLALGHGEPPPIDLPTFQWDIWTFELTPEGTVNRRYVSLDEYEEVEVLFERARQAEESRRAERGVEPNIWRVIYALCPETDMIYRDRDGTRYRQVAGMGTDEKAWALLSEQQFYDAAYAFSRGNLKIEATDVVMSEPMLGEYHPTCFFWPRDWADLGIGLEVKEHDSLVGHYFPGPTRPWARGGTGGQGDWMSHLGHTSVQFAPGREQGGSLTDLCRITLHEWLHQIAYFPSTKSTYTGLPTQYDAGNLHGGSHLYWMHDVLTPKFWRTVHTQIPVWCPPNKPRDRYAGFVSNWLVAGVFDLPADAATGENMIPAADALDIDFVDASSVLPDVDQPVESHGDLRWKVLKRAWRSEPQRTNLIRLRSMFASPHRDSVVYAHTYINSPKRQEAILWMTGETPFAVWLNGQRVLQCWGGVAEDEASRRVVLMPGWNQLLVKVLDQEAPDWWFAARFTDVEHNEIGDLAFSHQKPDGSIVAATDAEPPPPIEIAHHAWSDVEDDWFGLLPLLTEQHFEALFQQEGVRLVGPPLIWNDVRLDWYLNRRWTMVDVSGLDGVQSRTVPPNCALATLENDAAFNNVLNLARRTQIRMHYLFYESMAIVRYTRPDGSVGDLVLVRPDMVEPFINLARYPQGWRGPKHGERIIGYVCRDTRTYVCFDTNLGDPLPVNELDVLRASDDVLMFSAATDVPRVLRGEPCQLTVSVTNTSDQTVDGVLAVCDADGGEVFAREELSLPAGARKDVALPLGTREREAGTLRLESGVTYSIGGEERTLSKPVLLPVFDAVGVKVRVEGPELLTAPEQTVVVTVTNNVSAPSTGEVTPAVPAGWTVEPARAPFELPGLDDVQELRFRMHIGSKVPDGPVWLKAVAKLDASGSPLAEGGVHVYKHFAPVLLRATFEDGIDGDFGFIYQGLYDVQLSRDEPAVGDACLQVSDRGGQRFGHAYAYGKHTFKPGEIVPYDTDYSYDTRMYPLLDFWFKMEAESRFDNIGLSVVLDDEEGGYGVLINGEWEQQWAPKVMVGRVEDFRADGQWHHIVINLDEMLDAYLGDTSHYVKEMYIGDTRSFSSGWWSDYRHHKHYLDEFQVRRDADMVVEPANTTPSGLPRYSRTHHVPAFESEVVDGLKATLRFDQLGYLPWEEPRLQVWLTNRGDQNVRIATTDRDRLWQIRIRDEAGAAVTDDWVNAWSDPQRASGTDRDGQPQAAEHFKVLKPGESHVERRFPLRNLFDHWASLFDKKLEPGHSYQIQLRYTNKQPGIDWGPAAWVGSVESNASELTLAAVPSDEEELSALVVSGDWQRRAKAAAQLGKHQCKPAVGALVRALLEDRNGDVRLNAAWALGEMGRVDSQKPVSAAELAPAVDGLIEALADSNGRVAEYAGMSLGRLGDRRATASLVNRLDDPSKWVRRQTADALAKLDNPQAVPSLAERLGDPSREVRRAVIQALVAYCERAAEPAKGLAERCRELDASGAQAADLDAARDKLEAAQKAFAVMYEMVSPALKDEYWVVRRSWVEALPRLAAAADVLPAVLKSLDDPHDGVRAAALRALGKLQQQASDHGELDEFRRRTSGVAGRLAALLDDYYTPVREQAVDVFEKVVGKSVEEATGQSEDTWRRRFPRPGDPRSPHAATWRAQQAREAPQP